MAWVKKTFYHEASENNVKPLKTLSISICEII